MNRPVRLVACFCLVALLSAGTAHVRSQTDMPARTPEQLVEAYDSLATSIIAANKTEWNLVHAILAMTYRHAQGTLAAAKANIRAGKGAKAEIEKLASLVAQLGNEGDASVAAIRKRLVESGHHHHHHHAKGEESPYDPGFVIVTREAKKMFLDAAGKIGKMAGSPDAKALDAEWKKVEKAFAKLHEKVES